MSKSSANVRWVRRMTQAAFTLWLVLSLTTPSWRYGAFSWWPIWQFPELAGGPVELGLLNGLPLVVLAGWLLGRERRRLWPRAFLPLTLPFLALSLWALLRLDWAIPRFLFIHGGGLALAWLVYLYVVDERPSLVPALGAVLVIQGSVALGQFFLQADLGLVAFGELPLNPAFRGVTVLYARGQPWLRAYGLTAHPNLLGAMQALLLLLLLPAYGRGRLSAGRRVLFTLALVMGLLGLLVSFSRTAWLALLVGLAAWLLFSGADVWRRLWHVGRARAWQVALLLLPLALLLFAYRDLIASRFFALDTPIEAQSINQRLADAQMALQLISVRPWLGVGLGRFMDAARLLNPDAARVHNVPLLAAAELGLPGLLLTLWLFATPLWLFWRRRRRGLALPGYTLAPWLAMIVLNLFDTMLWFSSNWQTAILFALLLAWTGLALAGEPQPIGPSVVGMGQTRPLCVSTPGLFGLYFSLERRV